MYDTNFAGIRTLQKRKNDGRTAQRQRYEDPGHHHQQERRRKATASKIIGHSAFGTSRIYRRPQKMAQRNHPTQRRQISTTTSATKLNSRGKTSIDRKTVTQFQKRSRRREDITANIMPVSSNSTRLSVREPHTHARHGSSRRDPRTSAAHRTYSRSCSNSSRQPAGMKW